MIKAAPSFSNISTATPKQREELLKRAQDASELLKALSHESRLLILCLLSESEKSVSEIEEIMDLPQAAVSQQLARLRGDGLVKTRRDGRSIYYSIADRDVLAIVDTLHELFCKPATKKPARKSAR